MKKEKPLSYMKKVQN